MIVKKDGTKVRVNIGENENDPVFVITDLLVHLAGKQMSQKASEVIEGDNLDLLIGSRPLTEAEGLKEDEKEAVKAGVLRLMEETYGIGEEDFVSAELEIVPAGKARDCGIDRSMILSYGQDRSDKSIIYSMGRHFTDIFFSSLGTINPACDPPALWSADPYDPDS